MHMMAILESCVPTSSLNMDRLKGRLLKPSNTRFTVHPSSLLYSPSLSSDQLIPVHEGDTRHRLNDLGRHHEHGDQVAKLKSSDNICSSQCFQEVSGASSGAPCPK